MRFTPYTTFITFAVKAQNDAILALSDQLENPTKSYEVVIGANGNTRTEIRSEIQTSSRKSALTPSVLNKDQFREFWISWNSGVVSVGTGSQVNRNM